MNSDGHLVGCSTWEWTGHLNITATVVSLFSGWCAKAGSPVLDISAVAGPQFFFPLQAANAPKHQKHTDPGI